MLASNNIQNFLVLKFNLIFQLLPDCVGKTFHPYQSSLFFTTRIFSTFSSFRFFSTTKFLCKLIIESFEKDSGASSQETWNFFHLLVYCYFAPLYRSFVRIIRIEVFFFVCCHTFLEMPIVHIDFVA